MAINNVTLEMTMIFALCFSHSEKKNPANLSGTTCAVLHSRYVYDVDLEYSSLCSITQTSLVAIGDHVVRTCAVHKVQHLVILLFAKGIKQRTRVPLFTSDYDYVITHPWLEK